jgi:hypothetical protein
VTEPLADGDADGGGEAVVESDDALDAEKL